MQSMSLLILVPAIALAGYFVLRIIRGGGIKGALFGAPIDHTIGEVGATGLKFMRMVLRVHKLRSTDSDKAVALEVICKTFLS